MNPLRHLAQLQGDEPPEISDGRERRWLEGLAATRAPTGIEPCRLTWLRWQTARGTVATDAEIAAYDNRILAEIAADDAWFEGWREERRKEGA